MIIKQPPNFFPLTNDRFVSGHLNGHERNNLTPETFALLLNQARLPGGNVLGMQQAGPDTTSDLLSPIDPVLGESDFSSILTTVMQLAAVSPTPSSGVDAAGRQSQLHGGIRRAVSAYAPQYVDQGVRQKIDFSSRASFPDPLESLSQHVLGQNASHGPNAPRTENAGLEKARADQSMSALPAPRHPASHPGRLRDMPGFLAARFESRDTPDAIGYDRRGGTCYGIYQLSSRMGTMDAFLSYLDKQAPEWAERLRAAGPANTRGTGGAMPRAWKRISAEALERFAELQHDFVHQQYYRPAARAVQRRIGLEPDSIPPALREVIWSTAVQHGVAGAANIFERAASRLDGDVSGPEQERDLIKAVYAERGKRFSGSTKAVRASVQERFAEEMQLALALLPQTMDRQV